MTIDLSERPGRLTADLSLPPRLRAILEAEYPRFSNAEMTRRRAAIGNLLGEFELDHLVYCGANRFGSAVQWLTGWPVTAEAVGVLTPKIPDALFIQHINHVPLARQLAAPAEVAWGGASSMAAAVAALERRGARAGRVGVIGPMTFEQHAMLAARFGTIVNLNRRYVRLRQIKSPEEIDWMRIGAAMTDRGMAALRDGLGARADRARASRSRRTLLHRARRHQRDSFFRRHADGRSIDRRADAICRQPQGQCRRCCRSGNIPDKCCAVSQWALNHRNSTAICTPRPMPLSMRLPPCSKTARRRARSSMRPA